MNGQKVPRDLEYAAVQYRVDDMKARDVKNRELLTAVRRIEERYTREINEFLGSKAEKYKSFYEKRRETAIKLEPKFTPTSEGSKAEIEFNKTRLSEANEFIRNIGVDAEDIKSIRCKYLQEYRQAVEKDRG